MHPEGRMKNIFTRLKVKKTSDYVFDKLLRENIKMVQILGVSSAFFALAVFLVWTYRDWGHFEMPTIIYDVSAVIVMALSAWIIQVVRKYRGNAVIDNIRLLNAKIATYSIVLMIFAVICGVTYALNNLSGLMFNIICVWLFGLLIIPSYVLFPAIIVVHIAYFLSLMIFVPGTYMNVYGNIAFMLSLLVIGYTHYRALRDKYVIEEKDRELFEAAENERWKDADRYNQETQYYEALNMPSVLYRAHHDLTRNQYIDSRGKWCEDVFPNQGKTFDFLSNLIPELAERDEDYENLKEMTGRENLIDGAQNGVNSYTLSYAVKKHFGEASWVKLDIHLYVSPKTGNIESFIYLTDVSLEHLERMMLERFKDFGYITIGYIDTVDNTFTSFFYRYYEGSEIKTIRGDFSKRGEYFEASLKSEKKKQEFCRKTDLAGAIEELERDEGPCFVRIESADDRHFQIDYSWLDQEKKRIFFMISDKTAEVVKERNTKSQFNAMSLAISRTYTALYHFNLVNNTETEIRSDEALAGYMPESADIDTAIRGFETHDLTPEEVEANRDFWDFSTISERMKDRDVISRDVFTKQHGWMNITCVAYKRDKEGNVLELLWMTKDIDEEKKNEIQQQEDLKKANEAAMAANRAKTTFLSNMSHDIRTPMNAILGFAGIASEHVEDHDRVQDCISKIFQAGNHLQRLINDILDMSHIESGNMNIKETKCNLSQVLHDVIPVIQPQFTAKKQSFFVSNGSVKDENVYLDPLKFNQILINLLGNAVKFTPVGGSIRVTIEEYECGREGYAGYKFKIADTGIGMSKEFQERIFQPFERESTSTVSKTEGTGLGLSIAKNIVDIMGGTLSVKSELGKGTEFTLDIALKLQEDKLDLPYNEKLVGKRALVVCEVSAVCDCLSSNFKRLLMEVEHVPTVEEARELSEKAAKDGNPYDVCVIDWGNLSDDVPERVRHLKAAACDKAGIICVTCYDWSGIVKEAKEAGLSTFVTKPVFASDLERAVLVAIGDNETGEAATENETILSDEDVSGKKLLVVEDNDLNREIAYEVLTEAGFKVDTASDGSEAIEKLRNSNRGDYDVILMDIQMPMIDGYEATREIRKMEEQGVSDIPIIAMTANAFEEDRRRAIACGMNDHIAKPIDVKLLMKTIKKYI